MNDFAPLLDLLSGKLGWLPTVLLWIGALRLPMKFLQSWLQNVLTAFVARIVASPQTDDDAQLRRLFDSLGYRMLVFSLDAILSLKLPTSESLDTHQQTQAAQPNPRNGLNLFLPLVLCALLVGGCTTLAPEGVYHGDRVLYNAELATTTSYDLLKTFLDWERANQAPLAEWPKIHESAEYIRAHWEQWFATAYALHDAYAADPTSANAAALQRSLNVLRTAMAQAAGYMAQATH